MNIVFEYKSNEKLRKSLSKLSTETFGISFEEWYQKGLWQDNYKPYSIVEMDEIVSNVSISKFKFIIEGKEYKALQLGTVMTKQSHRGKGYSKTLINFVLDKYKDDYDFLYLFPNNSVFEFYKKFGFEEIIHKKIFTKTKISINKLYNFQKIDINNKEHLNILKELGENRICHSKKFDVIGGHEIMFWHCVNGFKNNLYINNEKNILVIYNKDKESLNIYDIISVDRIDYYELIGSLMDENIKRIDFDFNLELRNVYMEEEIVNREEDALFVMGNKELLKKVIYPITSHA